MLISVLNNDELDEETLHELIKLCSEAYEEDFNYYFSLLKNAKHVIGYLDGKIVSHAAYVERILYTEQRSYRAAYIEAVATHPSVQGKGLGSQIMSHITTLIDEFELGALSPSEHEFYARLGWSLWEGPLGYYDQSLNEFSCPDEEVMIYQIGEINDIDFKGKLLCNWREGDVW
ncbi:GNAT family N-acetyltransferase [Vibrio vulnificus]|uniref:GNAT family N-acetyltransferase n=1 Tax=Vibrio vulnificus TaxID=672 RepID=A0A8H9N4Y6_VIBVL|nr:GNAT family N-acetyltransferase [Vibrio cholerae]EGQ7759776.1 GNAT family N-acetyltransferase [Vibrio vulnificus]EFH74997.1 predicted protein [Vibrio cholerae RC385]EGQ7835300.1 GNAT family N-acetyltransferase [Vibrio vulnificus]EGR0209131.1 GNAT family N-acetyltransferase [Vibrio vulnificus]EHD2271052.1 GNAT family N-acetyltransferase [Vibrio cholerae]